MFIARKGKQDTVIMRGYSINWMFPSERRVTFFQGKNNKREKQFYSFTLEYSIQCFVIIYSTAIFVNEVSPLKL